MIATIHTLAKEEKSATSLSETFNEHDRALMEHKMSSSHQTAAPTVQALPPQLQRAVQILCETYEAIDLRIETTLQTAEIDFLAAMPKIKGFEAELNQLVKFLISDLQNATPTEINQPLLLRLTYQNKEDLVEQLLSGAQAHLVVMPAEENLSLHTSIQGNKS